MWIMDIRYIEWLAEKAITKPKPQPQPKEAA
jgi:hypothetical protein